nr:6646_t:CDS:2 [Entrophospora candida]
MEYEIIRELTSGNGRRRDDDDNIGGVDQELYWVIRSATTTNRYKDLIDYDEEEINILCDFYETKKIAPISSAIVDESFSTKSLNSTSIDYLILS